VAQGPMISILVTIRITIRIQESEFRNPHSLDYRKKVSNEQGRSDGGGYWYLYSQKSAQVNFLWGKNDVRTAIQQFYTLPPPKKKNLYPKTNFWLRPWQRILMKFSGKLVYIAYRPTDYILVTIRITIRIWESVPDHDPDT